MSWPMVELKKLVLKVDKWNPVKDGGDDQITYIDLSSVDKDSKAIKNEDVQKIQACLAPSRARQLVDSADVLVATVRPNLNGVALVSSDYQGATASTGYCVLRPNNKLLDSKYLFYWVQTESFVSDMMGKATGANYPAVSDKIVKESQIPLPPLDEQKRIAAILDKADAIRQKRKQAIALADEFLRSVFLEMFGDPVTNPKGWEVKPFGDVIETLTDYHANGSYKTLNANVTLLDEPNYAYMVRTTDLEKKNYVDGVKYIDQHAYEHLSKSKVFGGEIIVNKIGSAGSLYLMPTLNRPVSLAMNQFLVRCKSGHLNEFYYYQLSTEAGHREIQKRVQGAVTKTITKDALREISVISPSLHEQKEFLKIVNAYKANLEEKLTTSLNMSVLSFESLSQKAFSGQL
ncbi:TPA: restriction endonuclease subunit S [Vibrio vulnificus]|nr:restriction endonuclease subunit S [Vibrio vulnificus]